MDPEEIQSDADLVRSLLVEAEGQDGEAGEEDGGAERQEEEENSNADEGADAEGEDGNPEEGTDAEGDEGHEGEEPEGEEAEESDPDPLYPVTIDGKEERITLKEALQGYQRLKDYTRKTQEVAEARKVADAELAQVRAHRDAYGKVLEVLKARLGPESGDRTAQQWNELRAADPAKYATEWADYQRVLQQRGAIEAEQKRVGEEAAAEGQKKLKAHIEGEREKLQAAMPVLKDPQKGPAKIKELRELAVSGFGFTEAEVDQAFDHRILLLLDAAGRGLAAAKAAQAAKAKIAKAPKLPDPGAKTPAKSPKTLARAAQMKKFERSGDINDAISLLIS